MFYLIDCNNFYVSCERLFNPALDNKIVVVLSNNDGCVVARSHEAKSIGIAMGTPLFLLKDQFSTHDIHIFSANFSLYQNISARIMNRLKELAEDIEIYSIDEAFLTIKRFGDNKAELLSHAQYLQEIIRKEIGIPVSIGIGPTKVLAKLANHAAKKNPAFKGIYHLTGTTHDNAFLATIAVSDIWGVGRSYSNTLVSYQIKNAFDLKYANQAWIRKKLTVVGLRIVLELHGTSCISISDVLPQQLIHSRSFGSRVTSQVELERIANLYVDKAAKKLRKHAMLAQSIGLFITTGKHAEFYYSNAAYSSLAEPTHFTPLLFQEAKKLLTNLYKTGFGYKKIGIILYDLVHQDERQISCFVEPKPDREKQTKLVQAIDAINYKWGNQSIFFGAPYSKSLWQGKSTKKSPNYLTRWNELPKVKS